MVLATFNGIPGANVTITGGTGVTIPNSSQTLVNGSVNLNGAGQTARTVTAGKTFYLLGFILIPTTGAACAVTFKDPTDATAYTGCTTAYVDATHAGQSTSVQTCVTYAAATNVRVAGTSGAVLYFWGVEV